MLGCAVITYYPGLGVGDFNLRVLYMLAVSSLSKYDILLAGWSAYSKYAFLGALSTAQLISYAILIVSWKRIHKIQVMFTSAFLEVFKRTKFKHYIINFFCAGGARDLLLSVLRPF